MLSTGPPTGAPIPSNLDRDDAAWVSKEVTFSPFYTASLEPSSCDEAKSGGTASSLVVLDSLTATSCYDQVVKALWVTATIKVSYL